MKFYLKQFSVDDLKGFQGNKHHRILKRLLMKNKKYKIVMTYFSSREDEVKNLLVDHGIQYLRMSRKDARYTGLGFYLIESQDDINYLKLFETHDMFSSCICVYNL